MQEYKTVVGAGESLVADKVTGCDSWEELAALVQETEGIYTQQANGARRLGRTIGDYAIALKTWANLLPTDKNMSIMVGGVKLVIKVSESIGQDHSPLLMCRGCGSTK